MKKVLFRCWILFSAILFVPLVAWPEDQAVSSFHLIDDALKKGEIDYGTSLVYQMYALHCPERLQPRFRGKGDGPFKSATPLFLEIWLNWEKLDKRTQEILAPFFARPTEPGGDVLPGGHSFEYDSTAPDSFFSQNKRFKIWYVTATEHAPNLRDVFPRDGIPDYINICALILDNVWSYEVTRLGYREPMKDGGNYYQIDGEDYGGDDKYDVYVVNLPTGYLGVTIGEYRQGTFATSYILIDNDYSDCPTSWEDILKVTLAHEFFHAIQFAYDVYEDRYFMELSATWMEDQVYDWIDDYQGLLPYFFHHPEWSLTLEADSTNILTEEGLHMYGSCIWAIYLSERYSVDMIRQIWEECDEINSIQAFDLVFSKWETNFRDSFREFTVWNYFTGEKADPDRYYSEGEYMSFQVAIADSHSACSDTVSEWYGPESTLPCSLGANYITFKTDTTRGGLSITFDGDDDATWKAATIGIGRDSSGHIVSDVDTIFLNTLGYGAAKVRNWDRFDEIVLVVSVVSGGSGPFPYSYTAVFDSTLYGQDVTPPSTRVHQNFPNPFLVDTHGETFFSFELTQNSPVELSIYTLAGQLVRELASDPDMLSPGIYDKYFVWDGRNEAGNEVANGIYLYQLRAGGVYTKPRKLAVVK